ncbi:MAG: ATP-binding protein [Anaerolineae bacterium]
MHRRRAPWTTLAACVPLPDGQVPATRSHVLREGLLRRMQVRRAPSYGAYLDLLAGRPSEYLALTHTLLQQLGPTGRSRLRRPAHLSGQRLRELLEALPAPALIAQGCIAGDGWHAVACNRAARHLLGTEPEGAQWLWSDRTPCAFHDLPLWATLLRGHAVANLRLFVRDDAGRLRPVLLSARRLAGYRPPRALVLLQRLAAGESAAAGVVTSWGSAIPVAGVFEFCPVPQVLTDRSGTVWEANERAREVFGAHERELIGTPLAAFVTDESLGSLQEALISLSSSGHGQARLGLQDRPGMVLHAHAGELPTAEGPRVLWVLHDESAQAAAERLRSDLVDLVLHDVRSPLATAMLGVESGERSLERGDVAKARASLAMATGALRRLGRLVDSLLDLSRLEAGQPLLRAGRTEPEPLLRAAAQELEPALSAHGLHLDKQVPADLPAVHADGDMLLRAVINLLENAVKFSPRGARIWLRAAAQDHGVLISVTDEGPGIPRELQPRVFDKFVGLHVPHAPRSYGLGLAFCKLAAEAHAGWIAVDSSPGRGSTFALWVPERPVLPSAVP